MGTFSELEKSFLRTRLAPEMYCDDCLFDGTKCWTFREERGYFFCELVYAKARKLLALDVKEED